MNYKVSFVFSYDVEVDEASFETAEERSEEAIYLAKRDLRADCQLCDMSYNYDFLEVERND